MAGETTLLAPEPDAAAAETYFGRALAVARQQQAKSWELRAATSMARLWRDQDKRQRARELLAPVYGWFTEGFDTLDLKAAKSLLDELASFVIENGWNVSVWPLRKSGRRSAQPMTLALRAALWLLSNRPNRNVESRSQGQMSTPIKIAAAAGRVSGRKRTSRRAAAGLLSITRVVAHSLESSQVSLRQIA